MTAPSTRTGPGAELTYDVRPGTGDGDAVLLLVGSPMGASGSGTLAGYFPDRTVVTYDPRGAERSRRTDGAATSTPEEHADDLHRLVAVPGAGPVDLSATSGGAVDALALVARHPDQVRSLVAHEPPVAAVLPDRGAGPGGPPAGARDLPARREGPGHGRVLRAGEPPGRAPRRLAAAPGARPGGVRSADRRRRLPGRRPGGPEHRLQHPPRARRRGATERLDPDRAGCGAASGGQLAHRGALAVAGVLGSTAVVLPGGHTGFLGGGSGQTGEPEPFALRLREVLDGG